MRRSPQSAWTPPAPFSGPVAQLAEQQTLNLLVEGSIPSGLTTPRFAPSGFATESLRRSSQAALASRARFLPGSPLNPKEFAVLALAGLVRAPV